MGKDLLLSVFSWNQYDYTIQERKSMASGVWRGYYRCKFFRGNHCKSRLIVVCIPKSDNSGEFDVTVTQNQPHSCGNPNTKYIYDFEVPVDVQCEMREYLERRALEDSGIATDLAKECLEQFCGKYLSKFNSKCNLLVT